jgi:hypothetical protein
MEFNDGWLGVMHKHRQRSINTGRVGLREKKAKRIEKKTRIEEKVQNGR